MLIKGASGVDNCQIWTWFVIQIMWSKKYHDDVIKWEHFPRNWPFVRGIHRSPVDSPPKGQWRALIFSLISVWINDWVNNREAGDLRRYHAHYDVIVMIQRLGTEQRRFSDSTLCRSATSIRGSQFQSPPLQWRHNERDGVSNHGVLLSPGADQRKHQHSAPLAFVSRPDIPSQRASNAEKVSIWWRHHDCGVSAGTMIMASAAFHYSQWAMCLKCPGARLSEAHAHLSNSLQWRHMSVGAT